MTGKNKKRLCLIDGSGYIYRAFFALPPMKRHSDGLPVNAVFGFTSMLMQFMAENADDCVVVVFDTSRQSFRSEFFSEYKANRREVPEDLIPQFPLIRDVVQAFDIANVELEGYEADDLIASYAQKAVSEGYQVVIVSADKDLMQLMHGEDVLIYDPIKKKYLTEDDVIKKFGVLPQKVVEVQALMGDPTDNIPGVRGIGPKTASELINQYGSVEDVYAHLDELSSRKKELLEQGKEDAIVSKKLVTLEQNAPLPKSINSFCSYIPDENKIKTFLNLMGFFALQNRLASFMEKRLKIFHEKLPQKENQLSFDLEQGCSFEAEIKRFYECVQDEETLLKWCEKIEKASFVALDTETDALDSQTAQIAGISLCVEPGKACYIPINHCGTYSNKSESPMLFGEMNQRPKQISMDFIKKHLLTLLMRPDIKKIGHNIKFDLEVIHSNFGVNLADDNLEDTIVMAYLLDGVIQKKRLDDLALRYLNEKVISYQEVCGVAKGSTCFKEVDLEKATQYAAEDADITLRLYNLFKQKLKDEKLENVYEQLDKPLISVLTDMENTGILVDKLSLQKLSLLFFQKINQLEAEIFELAGEHINLNSPMQLGELLFEKMNLEGGRKNSKTKKWITDSDVLEDMADKGIEIAQKILEFRQYTKLKSTYSDALVDLINPKSARVHTTFSQTMTATGRLSSNNPNLQNIPIKTELGREIRSAFIAKDGCVLISADYSQVELRLMAHVADVKQLKQDFIDGVDIHASTASKVFNVPIENIDPMVRRDAKAINFGIIYGISAFGLSKQLGISKTLAKQYIDSYFEKYPEIKKYMDETTQFASQNGYVLTPFGRKCYISGFDSRVTQGFAARAAINAPIQGGAADITKMAMIEIQKELKQKNMKTKMLLQVHDELVFEVPEAEVEDAKQLIKMQMENVVQLSVPLVVDIGVGKNWKEAH